MDDEQAAGALARLFDDFNSRFFGSRLPQYRVRPRHNPIRRYANGEHVMGQTNRERREILVWVGQRSSEEVSESLLHEMAHVAAGSEDGIAGHGELWRLEMRRLAELGAPLDAGEVRMVRGDLPLEEEEGSA